MIYLSRFTSFTKLLKNTQHADKLRLQLGLLDSAKSKEDMNVPAWRLHELKGKLKGHLSITVNGNWRLTFKFVNEDVELVDYQDYH